MKTCIIEHKEGLYAVKIKKTKGYNKIIVYQYRPTSIIKYKDKATYFEIILLSTAAKRNKLFNVTAPDYLYKLSKYAISIYANDLKTKSKSKNMAERASVEYKMTNEPTQISEIKEISRQQKEKWEQFVEENLKFK